MGNVSDFGYGHGDDTFRASGENSKRQGRYTFRKTPEAPGGIIDQLKKEIKQELAHHKEQIQLHQEQSRVLEQRLSQLDEVSERLRDNE